MMVTLVILGGGSILLAISMSKQTTDGDSGVLVVLGVSVMVIWGFWVVVSLYLSLVCQNKPLCPPLPMHIAHHPHLHEILSRPALILPAGVSLSRSQLVLILHSTHTHLRLRWR